MHVLKLGISIKHAPKTEVKEYAPVATTVSQVSENIEDYIFNERDVNYYWFEYAERLPQEQTALAGRMRGIRPKMVNDTTFEVVVDNEIVAGEFNAMISVIQDYMRSHLKNRKVTMSVRVSEPGEKVRAYSRVERFQVMAQKNHSLIELKEKFGLELS